MIVNGPACVCASLIAVLTDRFILDRCLGTVPDAEAGASTRMTSSLAAKAFLVPIILVAASGLASLLTISIPLSLGQSSRHLFMLYLVASIIVCSVAGETLASRWFPFSMLNRMFSKTMVFCSILGFAVVKVQAGSAPNAAFSGAQPIASCAVAGTIFAAVLLLFAGIREKTALARGPLTLSQELAAAGLMGLVLSSLFHFTA